jgi:2'-5' RNA ligase
MPRLFTGLEIPEEIGWTLARLTVPLPGATWIDKANYHVTLRFAGDIDNALAREFAGELARIDVDSFSMRLSGIGVFGGNEPRSIWAGVEGGLALEALARANERAARNAGLKPEPRNFAPHVTLARLKYPRPDAVARFLSRHSAFRTPEFAVSRFVLYSSKPSVGGGPYVIEDAFLLRGGYHGDPMTDEHW